ncbi:MAG TPA: GAF domain-containing sensor histidine kinase [Thermoanaerobaculia bacterium]
MDAKTQNQLDLQRAEAAGFGGPCPFEDDTLDPQALGAEALREALTREIENRRRAECSARMQSSTVQLALDLLVSERDLEGFFRVFMKTLIEECDSHAVGVFLLDDEATQCELWMAYVGEQLFAKSQPDWDRLQLPRETMAHHLLAFRAGWTETIEYAGDDPRLPAAVREFNAGHGLQSLCVTPLQLADRNLGWIALSTGDAPPEYGPWRRALLEAVARQATLALHQSQLAEQSRIEARHQAVLEERNRLARDIHDTLAQGFAGILMQLQSAQRSGAALPKQVAQSIDNAVDLARSHMIEARRSVCALRPQTMESGDFSTVLERSVELARRVTDVPIDVTIEELPPFGAAVESELAGIVQEALSNAVRHARARRIRVHASSVKAVGFRLSVADDGRGIAKERFGAGFGLTSMQERAERIGASLTIVTAPRAGTEIVLAWDPPQFTIPSHASHH